MSDCVQTLVFLYEDQNVKDVKIKLLIIMYRQCLGRNIRPLYRDIAHLEMLNIMKLRIYFLDPIFKNKDWKK